MHYRVRNADGEIALPGISDVVRAFEQGLVDADDEVSVDGGPWRKAAVVPELRAVLGRQKAATPEAKRWYRIAAFVGALGLFVLLFVRGWWMAAVALVVAGALSSWVAVGAMKKRRR